jgi:release factor glutamine methyltransferase
MPDIYQPAEDSYLLDKILRQKLPGLLKNKPDLKFLEIGAGSGILLETAKELGVKEKNIFAGDINQDAVSHCKKLGFNCILSDLFENIEGQFDIIIFNPPYLPEDEEGLEPEASKLATTGGASGSEIVNKFLEQAKDYLEDDGKIFLLTSSLTEDIDWKEYHHRELGKEKMFMEELFVWELAL